MSNLLLTPTAGALPLIREHGKMRGRGGALEGEVPKKLASGASLGENPKSEQRITIRETRIMPINLNWTAPFDLVDGSEEHLIYAIPNIDRIPEEYGVYVFSRLHGNNVTPLYIGKSTNVRQRIRQHLCNNVRLMKRIRDTTNGQRVLHVGVLGNHGGMSADKAITIAERGLIAAAILEGHAAFNEVGANRPVYRVEASGNKQARAWWPDQWAFEVLKKP